MLQKIDILLDFKKFYPVIGVMEKQLIGLFPYHAKYTQALVKFARRFNTNISGVNVSNMNKIVDNVRLPGQEHVSDSYTSERFFQKKDGSVDTKMFAFLSINYAECQISVLRIRLKLSYRNKIIKKSIRSFEPIQIIKVLTEV